VTHRCRFTPRWRDTENRRSSGSNLTLDALV
jgi:hypothetical protein